MNYVIIFFMDMRRLVISLFIVAAIVIAFYVIFFDSQNQANQGNNGASDKSSIMYTQEQNSANKSAEYDLASPIDRAGERVTKKPFGIYVTPANSPVQPERFSGYHTGTDFEAFSDELEKDVPVKAICRGKILRKEKASGYGGVLVESCKFGREPITVVYGHLDLASISKKVGDNLEASESIGNLGKNKSAETDGERKHLHLGIHNGTEVNFLGYVPNQSQLSDWIDACNYICY
ncbi:MAG TPA: hypothetical protein DIC35_02365 [Candidatus Moranbacteria bacterium]|nr:hypothetical protein [Candidatus Moranbacteria bacterium]